jgi:N6-adenosine-specific RNA methylase IME4
LTTRLLEGMGPFSVVVADPPWTFGDALGKRGAAANYDLLTQPQIESYAGDIGLVTDRDALLFMWRVSSQPEEATRTCRAWGFTPKSEIIWVKTTASDDPKLAFGMGRYVRMSHETCIIAAKGSASRLIENKGVRSVIIAPRGEHSAKPDAFYETVESLVGSSARIVEFFARRRRDGWTCVGNEL